MAIALSMSLLDTFVGESIEDICPLHFGTKGDVQNHCAHFVGHVLKLNGSVAHGLTCAGMVSGGNKHTAAGAIIRVNDIYNICADLTEPNALGCLAYYTMPGNIGKDGMMGTMPKKHVGLCCHGFVYNYGNANDKVRKNKVGDLKALYGPSTITRYTALPNGATLLTLDQILALVPKKAEAKK